MSIVNLLLIIDLAANNHISRFTDLTLPAFYFSLNAVDYEVDYVNKMEREKIVQSFKLQTHFFLAKYSESFIL